MARKPSLDIALGSPDIAAFKSQMNEASNHVGTVARRIGKQFLDMNEGIKDGLLASASSLALGMVGKIALVVGAFKLMSDAISSTRAQLADMVALADKATNLGISPQFLQSFTGEARKLKVEAGELESALGHAFSATRAKSPIDIGAWETGKEQITEVEKALRVLNTTVAGGKLEGLVLFRDADTQEGKVIAVLRAMQQLEQIGQRAAALDLGERMFGSQFVDRIRQGKTSAESLLATMKTMTVESGDLFLNDLVVRAKQIDDQLKIAENRLSAAMKPAFNDLASVMLDIKSTWADIVNLIGQAVEWTNKLGLTSEIMRKKNELAAVNGAIKNGTGLGGVPQVTAIPGVGKIYDAIGAEKPQDALQRRRDQLQAEIDAAARGAPEGPEQPKPSRGTGAAPTLKPTGGESADKLQTALDAAEKRTAALIAEAGAVDLTTEARNRLKIVAQLETVARQANSAAGKGSNLVTEEQRKKINEVADAYAAATKALEKNKIASDIRRGSQTALLDPADVQIAERLRDIYPDVATALGSVEASAMRTNDIMKSIGATMSSSLTTGLADILDGTKSVSDGFASMANSIVRSIEEAMIKMLIVQPLMRSLSGGLGGLGFADGGIIPKFADGGTVSGPGGPREDRVLARLSPGEFVTNAASTSKHLALLQAINVDRVPRFADGGMVGSVRALNAGNQTTIAPQISVTVQGSPGASQADHEAMGRTIASQIEPAIRGIVAKEVRTQMRPGGIFR